MKVYLEKERGRRFLAKAGILVLGVAYLFGVLYENQHFHRVSMGWGTYFFFIPALIFLIYILAVPKHYLILDLSSRMAALYKNGHLERNLSLVDLGPLVIFEHVIGEPNRLIVEYWIQSRPFPEAVFKTGRTLKIKKDLEKLGGKLGLPVEKEIASSKKLNRRGEWKDEEEADENTSPAPRWATHPPKSLPGKILQFIVDLILR